MFIIALPRGMQRRLRIAADAAIGQVGLVGIARRSLLVAFSVMEACGVPLTHWLSLQEPLTPSGRIP